MENVCGILREDHEDQIDISYVVIREGIIIESERHIFNGNKIFRDDVFKQAIEDLSLRFDCEVLCEDEGSNFLQPATQKHGMMIHLDPETSNRVYMAVKIHDPKILEEIKNLRRK